MAEADRQGSNPDMALFIDWENMQGRANTDNGICLNPTRKSELRR